MFKQIKVGTSLFLSGTIILSTIAFSVKPTGLLSPMITAQAVTCSSISECMALSAEASAVINDLIGQETEVSAKINDLSREIDDLRIKVEGIQATIEDKIADIVHRQEDIVENRELLAETEENIQRVMNIVAERMIFTHRMENTTSVLSIMLESDSLTGFISEFRNLNRMVQADREARDELDGLLALYDSIIADLYGQITELKASQDSLEEELVRLDDQQEELVASETALREQLYALNLQRMDEESVRDAAEAAAEVIRNTPPPPVVTNNPPAANNDSGASNNNNNNNNNAGSNNQASAPSNNATSNAPATVPSSSGMINPIPGSRVTSEFGPRGGGFHWGIDIQIFGARPNILAAASGVVTINAWDSMAGWYIVLSHDINGQRVDTLYAHMESQSPHAVGTIVEQGEAIGIQGNTGLSFGAHLHFEVHPGGFRWNNGVNPREWVNF